nr:DUF4402 domain-containing protein [Oceanospirillum sediminis]
MVVASAVTVAHAANNAVFDINAEIPADLDVATTQNMDFGLLNPGAGGGSVTIDTAGAINYGGDVTSAGGTVQPAVVTLDSSTANLKVSLDTPDVTLVNSADSNVTMTVSGFTYQGGAGAGSNEFTLDGTNTTTLNVGATLLVGGNQLSGTYTGQATVTATIL